jgi:dCTP deaminase
VNRDDLWQEIEPGVLTDDEIQTLGAAGLLIVNGFDPQQVQQTCYELRVGKAAYFLSKQETRRKVQITDDTGDEGTVLLKPRDVVTVITLEQVELPDFLIGRVFTKGTLFSVGINPVVTYVDPGFAGNLGITLVNNSNRVFKLRHGESICKVEFERLRKPVKQPYRGVHFFASETWPFQMEHLMPPRELTSEEIHDSELFEAEMDSAGEPFDLLAARVKFLGDELARLARRTRFLVFVVIGGISLYLIHLLAIWLMTRYQLAPESTQASVIGGIIEAAGGILGVVLAWYLARRGTP